MLRVAFLIVLVGSSSIIEGFLVKGVDAQSCKLFDSPHTNLQATRVMIFDSSLYAPQFSLVINSFSHVAISSDHVDLVECHFTRVKSDILMDTGTHYCADVVSNSLQEILIATGMWISSCWSNMTTIVATKKFEIRESFVKNNRALYGGFATFMSSKHNDTIDFTVDNKTEVSGNHARIAGGRYFVFDPIGIAIISPLNKTKSGNTAGVYGDELAGFTSSLQAEYSRYIYPGQTFSISVRRYDRFGNFVKREVYENFDRSSMSVRVEGGSSQGNVTFLAGVADFPDISLPAYSMQDINLVLTPKLYKIAPMDVTLSISTACPPGFQLVCKRPKLRY